ncbi:hypothetical protein [Primorskyibacter sp. S187A]|uniref:hypothetical protein n=1 Tax=Primorskyibacter sp. S187A TaxID=3415130 RepID=UPI003C7E3414
MSVMLLRLWIMWLLIVPGLVAAGPWPRGVGTAFVSTATEVYEAEDGELSQYSSLYGEYGLTPKLSLGGKFSRGTEAGLEAQVHLGIGLLQRGPHALSVELSYTHRQFEYRETVTARRFFAPEFEGQEVIFEGFNPDEERITTRAEEAETQHFGIGLAYGRGFSLGDRSGWATLEASWHGPLEGSHEVAAPEIKVDGTLGLSFEGGWKAMMQVFTMRIEDETFVTYAPSVVIPMFEDSHVAIGLRILADTPEQSSLALGLWRDF